MNTRRRIIVAAFACLLVAGAPALAQVAPSNTTGSTNTTSPATNSATPAQPGVIGNPQLQGFSLNGTPTRTAQPPAPVPATRSAPSRAPAETQAAPARRDAPAPRTETPRPQRETGEAPAPATSTDVGSSPPASDGIAPTATPSPTPVQTQPADTATPAPSSPFGMLPWIVAALAIAGAGAWYFLRQRPRESFAGASDMFEAPPQPEAAPRPQAAPPAAAPAPPVQPAPQSTGVVSTRLRPWLEIEFKPDRGVVDDQKAAVAFEVSVYNSGSMPARDVLLEASLFNAGPMQDQQIQLFFDNPVARGDKIPVIPPMQRITVNTAVFLAKDQLVPIEMEGRAFFVPMVAFNALYSWSSGKGQTSASYLVGKETKGDKLAPFRTDLGPRIFRGLVARAHSVGLRK